MSRNLNIQQLITVMDATICKKCAQRQEKVLKRYHIWCSLCELCSECIKTYKGKMVVPIEDTSLECDEPVFTDLSIPDIFRPKFSYQR